MRFHYSSIVLLLITFVAIVLLYDFPALWQQLPQGSHLWRQADCWAMTENYQQFNLPFLKPEVYNLQAINGKSVGEFPLTYFIAAQFSNAVFALRFLHTFLFFVGIMATYFIAFFFLQRRFLALCASLLLLTSPLLIFYGNNFLTDVPALAFSYIAWAIFLYAVAKQNNLLLLFSFVFFTIAGLLKASQALNIIIASAFFLIQQKEQIRKKPPIAFLLFFMLSFAVLVLWYAFAKRYNYMHHDKYFFLNLFPVWKLSAYDIGLGAWRMAISWSNNYFWRPTLLLLLIGLGYFIYHRNKLDKSLLQIISLSILFTLVYIILFYQKLIGHEYYYTFFFIAFLFIIIGILKTYNTFHAENIFAHTVLFLLLLLNYILCKQEVASKQLDSRNNPFYGTIAFHECLETLGVDENKIILSLPDDSPNKTLSLLRRKGYTAFNDYRSILQNRQADFLILGNEDWKDNKTLLKYLTDSIGAYQNITIYKLK
ncbi:MAG TPA: glycosyltransferase family 39 protein [Chitinophagales bacterium]|nr:glycosyltransferase family 39 protein [Chitinophagales bacterium]